MSNHESYMMRSIQLASLGAGRVAPNPMVGAVLVHNEKIIGEGYHEKFGAAHAEVNCLKSVTDEDRKLIPSSRLYVSLEPCAHFGKTPPCADLIIKENIPEVIVACEDPFTEVNGRGIKRLRDAGIAVEVGVLRNEAGALNKRFFTFHREHRPYIILKWAQTADGKIANEDYSRIYISGELSNRTVHKWRSEEAAILVGTNTALFDDPQLNNRHWTGGDPHRLVVDLDLRLPSSLKVFDGSIKTIVFNSIKHEENGALMYYQVTRDVSLVQQIVHALYQLKISSVIVEGGAKLIQSFADEGYWDEARVITNSKLYAGSGIMAPDIGKVNLISSHNAGDDIIRFVTKD